MSFGLHIYWRHRTIREVLTKDKGQYLDIGCGTGDIALGILRRQPGSRITGIDISDQMLQRAKERTSKKGLSDRSTYMLGDATSLPFENQRFDGITCAFCLRNIVSHCQALDEMLRVLRPGGKVAILELNRPTSGLMRLVYSIHVHTIIPLLGRLLSKGSAYRYLGQSIDNFPPPDEVAATLSKSGFQNVETIPLTGGFATLFTGEVKKETSEQ